MRPKIIPTSSPSQIELQRLSDPASDLQTVHNLTRGAGHLTGGEITVGGAGTVDVAAGTGFIRPTADPTDTLFVFKWSTTTGLSVPDNSIRYVKASYNGGSPNVTLVATEDYDYLTSFPLGFVAREGATLYISNTPHSMGRGIPRLIQRNYEVDGRSRAHDLGGLIIGESGTRNVSFATGVTWFRGVREVIAAFDSSGSDTFDHYYRAATPGEWTKVSSQTQIPNEGWDDGTGALHNLGNNNRGVYWLYLGPAGGVVMVYGRGDYNQLKDAQDASPPSDLPPRLQGTGMLLGRFIVVRNAVNAEVVESAFTTTFAGGGSSGDHGALSGLGDDDHPHYQLRSEKGLASGYPSLSSDTVVAQPIEFLRAGLLGTRPVVGVPGQVFVDSAVGSAYLWVP